MTNTEPCADLPIAETEQLVDELESLLNRHGIAIAPGSDLERVCLEVRRLHELHRHAAPDFGDSRQLLREALGFHQFASMIAKSERLEGFEKMIPHLELLNRGCALQNTALANYDEASNKLFELLIGLAALNVPGASIEMDHPKKTKGNNPDVLALLDGVLWGFACKVPNGTAEMTLFENVAKGVEQIERSRADTGIVVLNPKNVLPHEALFPILGQSKDGDLLVGAYKDIGNVQQALAENIHRRVQGMQEHVGTQHVTELFANKKALPAVLVVAQAVVTAALPSYGTRELIEGKSQPHLVGFVQLVPFIESRVTESAMTTLRALNRAFWPSRRNHHDPVNTEH